MRQFPRHVGYEIGDVTGRHPAPSPVVQHHRQHRRQAGAHGKLPGVNQILVEQAEVIEHPYRHVGIDAGLEFQQQIHVEPIRSPAQPPDHIVAALSQPVVDKMGGVFFQGGEIKIGHPVLANEAAQQIRHHFGMGKQPFVTTIVSHHIRPSSTHRVSSPTSPP